jgi:thiol-disulfide isomerase/thioredoxin
MKNEFSLLLFLLFSVLLPAQETPVRAARRFNENMAAVEVCALDIAYRFKAALNEDTSIGRGRAYFFKTQCDPQGYGQFILWVDGKITAAYDGVSYYSMREYKKTIIVQDRECEGGLENLHWDHPVLLICHELLYCKDRPIIPTDKIIEAPSFAPDSLETTVWMLDSTRMRMKISEKDPDYSKIFRAYELERGSAKLLRRREWNHFTKKPQYLDCTYGPLRPLDKGSSFEQFFNLDSFIRAGYTIADRSLSDQKSQSLAIPLGSTMPAFVLEGENGASIRSEEIQEGLILLDFWFKNCYPCIQSFAQVEALHQKYGKLGLKVIGVNPIDRNNSSNHAFLRERGSSYLSAFDPARALATRLNISGYPTMILVDGKTKEVLYIKSGFSKSFEAEVSKLVALKLRP